MPPSTEISGTHTVYFKVPVGLKCEACTLQWHWWSANSCEPAGDYGCFKKVLQANGYWVGSKRAWWTAFGGACSGPAGPNGHSGCGEQFWNCADISVLPGSGVTSAPATSSTSVAITTAAPGSTTTSTLQDSLTCMAVPGKEQYGATDTKCTVACQVLLEGQWPCGQEHLCDCAYPATATTTARPLPTVPTPYPSPPTPPNDGCGSCTACLWSNNVCYTDVDAGYCRQWSSNTWCGGLRR